MSGDASFQVEELSTSLPNDDVWGSFRVKGTEGGRLELIGWVLGLRGEVDRVEVVAGGKVVAQAKPSLPRQELAEEFPDRESAATCGFAVTIEARGNGKSTLELRAVFVDGSEAGMGRIQVSAPGRRWAELFRRG
jgi:hypothetical protein